MSELEIRADMIDLPSGEIYVTRWRPAVADSAVPILLLHDSLGCVAMWREFPALLAAVLGREVIAYDRLGFGRSTPRQTLPELTFIIEEGEAVLPALCDALGLQQVVLFGHSVGGGMALTAAGLASFGSRCTAVVAVAAQAFVEPQTLAGIRAAQQFFAVPENFQRLVKHHGERAAWVLNAWTHAWLHPQFADWRLDHLAAVHCPVLAIQGDQDEYGSRAFADTIGRLVAGPSVVQVLDGVGHMPHREAPERVLAAVAEFLSHHRL